MLSSPSYGVHSISVWLRSTQGNDSLFLTSSERRQQFHSLHSRTIKTGSYRSRHNNQDITRDILPPNIAAIIVVPVIIIVTSGVQGTNLVAYWSRTRPFPLTRAARSLLARVDDCFLDARNHGWPWLNFSLFLFSLACLFPQPILGGH